MNKKILTICIIGMFLLINTFVIPVSIVKSTQTRIQHNYVDTPATILSAGSLSVDLQVRVVGDTSWQKSISANVGIKLEFKISIALSSVEDVMVVIQFPKINDGLLLTYVSLSASSPPLPIPLDDVVIWGFPDIVPSEITFKAEIKKSGTSPVNLNVGGDDTSSSDYLEDEDSVSVTGIGCCFPAGTKITMADRTIKNIEDIKMGDKVLSYDFEKEEYSSWIVKMLGRPWHPVYNINKGLIYATVDHPFFVKKENGLMGIGSIDAVCCKNSIIFEEEVFSLEQGDRLFTQDGNFVEITSISKGTKDVQTYNILSFSGTRNFFANGILVYEEHPPNSFTSPILERILEKMPRLTQFLFSTHLFNRLFAP